MRRLKRRKAAAITDINITPFTDVALVLLIVFMIVMPMLNQPSIEVNLPTVETTNVTQVTNVEVLIDRHGRVHIGGRNVHDNYVEETIRGLIAANPDGPVIIKGDGQASYDSVIRVVNKAKRAGASRFALAVELDR
ncbi:MAG: biopolymer transporter ExbD [Elusimicrobia bacterium]|nr:biopolymer transporter ExbD [Elusimicrobiota bacterium]